MKDNEKYFKLTLENQKFKVITNTGISDFAIKEVVKIIRANIAFEKLNLDLEIGRKRGNLTNENEQLKSNPRQRRVWRTKGRHPKNSTNYYLR